LLDAQLAANPDIERMLPQHGIAFSCGKSDLQVRPLSVAAWRAGKAGAMYSGTPAAIEMMSLDMSS
jgi:hypothetical protein